MSNNRPVKFFAYFFILFLSLIVLNIGCYFVIKVVYGTSIYGDDYNNLKLQFYKDKTQKHFVHPFFGLASTKDETFQSPLGIDHIFDSIDKSENKDEIKILIIGGSVAAFLSRNKAENQKSKFEQAVFFEELNKTYKTNRFAVYNAALGGGKQPQSYFKLIHLDLMGFKPDLVLNVDGFNEIALSMSDNFDASIPPIYPRQHNRAIARTALDKHCPMSNYLSSSNTKVPLIELMSVIYLSRCHNEINIGPKDKTYWGYQENFSYERYLMESINVWAESSNKINDFLLSKNIKYIHAIQPNQYHEESKPLNDEELNEIKVLGFPYYGVHIKNHYDKLKTSMLNASNISDLRFLFKTDKRTLYADQCCHFNDLGNRELARAIINQNDNIFRSLLNRNNEK